MIYMSVANRISVGGDMRVRNMIVAFIAITALVQVASAEDHWVTTWVASPQQGRGGPPPAAAQARGAQGAPPAAAPGGGQRGGPGGPGGTPAPTVFNDQTVRMIVHTTLGGRRARVTLSNAFGNMPLQVGAAHIALRTTESTIDKSSDRTLMFNGKPSVTIVQGAQMISDPVDLNIPQLGDIAVSVYVPTDSGQLTTHATGLHTTYIAKGNVTVEPTLNDATTTRSYYWISAVDVMAPADAGGVVAFGDSITDGATSTNDTDRS